MHSQVEHDHRTEQNRSLFQH